tara:strand:+ start:11368 stop:11862 length:495 start_codon:yes stop_codon:yes gene_type:complete
MSKDKELQDAFAKLLERDAVTFSATVLSVDKEKGTCLVSSDQLEYKVRLASVINDSREKFFLYPKLKSIVLVAPIEEDIHQLHVVKYSDIEQLRLRIGDTDFCIDKDGFNFKKENESLRSLILELIDGIKKMKFTTNMGPTINLINLQDFVAVEDKFKQLLKDI